MPTLPQPKRAEATEFIQKLSKVNRAQFDPVGLGSLRFGCAQVGFGPGNLWHSRLPDSCGAVELHLRLSHQA